MPLIEVARLDGPATVRGFDISISEHEPVQVQLERSGGSVLVSLAVVGPRSITRPIFEAEPSVQIYVLLKASRQVSGMIYYAVGPIEETAEDSPDADA